MPQNRKYYFLAPDVRRPVGGVAVIYAFVDILREAGYEAFVLQQSPRHVYGYSDVSAAVRYTLEARNAWLRHVSPTRRLIARARTLRERLKPAAVPKADLRPGDVVVAPEYYLDLLPDIFPEQVKVLLTQNNFTHLNAWVRAVRRGVAKAGEGVPQIATSKVCLETAERLGATETHYVPLHIDAGLFAYVEEKRKRIAFMPRKNGADAEVVTTLLRERGKVDDFELTPIRDMGREEVAETLKSSLIFLALSEREGFGLPPAEAMAAGCVVVGYRGHGGDEFFDEETGFPVRAGDLLAFVETVERVAAEYRDDPARLDDMRRSASRKVAETYSFDGMRDALLKAWEMLGQGSPAQRAGAAAG